MRLKLFAGILLAASLACVPGVPRAQVIAIASAPQGSIMYNASVAIAKVVNDKLNIPTRVQPTAGPSTFIPSMNLGEIEFGLINVDEVVTAFKGEDAFAGKPNPNLRIIAVMFQLAIGVVVPADSPAKTLQDLKGMRMPSDYAGQTSNRKVQDAVLATGGLSTADMKRVPVANNFQGVEALAAGRVDAATIAPGVAQVQKAHIDLSSRGGIRFLSINATPDGIEAMRRLLRSNPLIVQPAPQFPGIVGPTTVMAYNVFLVTNGKLADDVAYGVAKALHENRDELVKASPALNRFDPKRMVDPIDVTYHPGAVRFYREAGQWAAGG